MSGRVVRVVALVALALALSACVQVRSELEVLDDGTVGGFVEASFDRAALADRDIGTDEVLDEFPLDDVVVTPGIGADDRIEQVYAQGDDVVVALRFQGVDATELAVLDGSRPFTRTDDGGFAFDLTVDTDAYEPAATLQLAILFPFEVVDTNGELDGSTVEWNLDQGGGVQRLSAATSDEPYLSSPAGPRWLGVGLAIAVAVTIGGGSLMWLLARRSDAR